MRWILPLVAAMALSGCFLREAVESEPAPRPAQAALERARCQDALTRPQHFACGIAVSCRHDPDGSKTAIIDAAGGSFEVAIARDADFYSLTNRPDLVLVHDRNSPWVDVIWVLHFSPAGLRRVPFDHGLRGVGYAVRRYRDVRLEHGVVKATEELAGSGRPDRPPRTLQIAIPLD